MEKNAMTYDEYYEIIKQENDKLKKEIEIVKLSNNSFKNCCKLNKTHNGELVYLGFDKIGELLKSKQGRTNLINMLKVVFGEDFFIELTEEEKEKYKKQDIFLKDDLALALSKTNGNKCGYLFTTPNSWEELVSYMEGCLNVCSSGLSNSNTKDLYGKMLSFFNNLIETTYAKNIEKEREMSFVSKLYSEFLNSYEKSKIVNIEKNTYGLIKTILNKDNRKFIIMEAGEEKETGFGDAFIIICELFNNEINKLKAKTELEKEQLKINTQINKYFKRISKIPFDNLENKNFPKYTNEDYVEIINGVIDKFNDILSEDDKWLPYYTISLMHYASYFKTKYYDADKVSKKLNKLEKIKNGNK